MKLSNVASPSLSAWIVALAVVGVLAQSPPRQELDAARIARPPATDVSVSSPAMRGGSSEGAVDLLPFAYDLDDWVAPGATKPVPALVDAGT